MFIHLTATLTGGADEAIVAERHPSSLLSFAYAQTEPAWARVWERLRADGQPPRIILDSGAFTAFTLGRQYEPKEYASWALDFIERWQDRTVAIHAMNLDVIGDQAATWRNQRRLEKLGMTPMPIVTFDAPMRELRRALDEYDYIALGGLVPWSKQQKVLRGWLDTCYREVYAHADRTGVVRRLHTLGITQRWMVKRYPIYSADSSSFIGCIRYGRTTHTKLPSIPRYSMGDAQAHAAQHALRHNVRHLADLEREATDLWTRRGITWPEPSR